MSQTYFSIITEKKVSGEGKNKEAINKLLKVDLIGSLFLEIMTKSCVCCHHIFFSVLLLLPAPSFFRLSSCARLNIATAHFFNYPSLTNLTGAFH